MKRKEKDKTVERNKRRDTQVLMGASADGRYLFMRVLKGGGKKKSAMESREKEKTVKKK